MDDRDPKRASLEEFIEAARSHGAPDDFLAELLERRGWPRKEIYRTFGSLYERLTGFAIPTRGSGLLESARDAFWYLLRLARWQRGRSSWVRYFSR